MSPALGPRAPTPLGAPSGVTPFGVPTRCSSGEGPPRTHRKSPKTGVRADETAASKSRARVCCSPVTGNLAPQEHVERGLSSEVGVSVSEGGCCRGQRGRAGVASVSCVWSTGTRTCKQRSVNINSTVFKQDSGWAGLFFFLLRMSHRFRSREVFSTRTFVTWASSLHVTAESL